MTDEAPVIDESKCQHCHVRPAEDAHSCPYAEEIWGDYDEKCNCCPECERGCAEDI